MSMYGPNELLKDVHRRELCIGCGACVALCPYIKNFKGKTSMIFDCTLDQGRCFAFCPKTEVDLEALAQHFWGRSYEGSPLGPYRKIQAARAGGRMASGRFQGGGTVSALMGLALKSDLIDVAVLTDRSGLDSEVRLVTAWQEVASCAGTKLMASPTLSGLNTAVGRGYTRAGVVGTPCQMLAAAQMRTNPLKKDDFQDPVGLSVGLFCNWALDSRSLEALLASRVDVADIQRMDIPPPPADVMILTTTNGEQTIPLSEIKPLIPHTCFICLDFSSEFADVSVGMYEGRPGWNTLIVRTTRGEALVDAAVAEGFLETGPMPAKAVKHLTQAAFAKKERAVRTLLRKELINSENGSKRCAVRMSAAVMQTILSHGKVG